MFRTGCPARRDHSICGRADSALSTFMASLAATQTNGIRLCTKTLGLLSHTSESLTTFSITIWRTRRLDTCGCSTHWPLTSHGLFITRRELHMLPTMLLRNGLRNIRG